MKLFNTPSRSFYNTPHVTQPTTANVTRHQTTSSFYTILPHFSHLTPSQYHTKHPPLHSTQYPLPPHTRTPHTPHIPLHTTFKILTLSLAWMSPPLDTNTSTVLSCPFHAALWRGVSPYYRTRHGQGQPCLHTSPLFLHFLDFLFLDPILPTLHTSIPHPNTLPHPLCLVYITQRASPLQAETGPTQLPLYNSSSHYTQSLTHK